MARVGCCDDVVENGVYIRGGEVVVDDRHEEVGVVNLTKTKSRVCDEQYR
jgi:hypothetical protein